MSVEGVREVGARILGLLSMAHHGPRESTGCSIYMNSAYEMSRSHGGRSTVSERDTDILAQAITVSVWDNEESFGEGEATQCPSG